MTLFVQLLSGIQIGSIYALVALGYSIVYGIVRLINFAHGDIIMMGAYATWFCMTRLGLPIWASILFAIVFCSLLGMLIERIAYKPLRNSERISLLIVAIGISFFLQNVVQLLFKPDPRMMPNFFAGSLSFMGITFPRVTLVVIVVSALLMLGLTLLIKNTRMGKAMRAVSEDKDAAQLMGIDINAIISFSFGVGSALAAVASVLYVSTYSQISPTMGSMLGLKAFVAAVLGGIGSIPGAVLGGFFIGVAESFTKGYLSSRLADAVVFSILIVVLLIKPTGILGSNASEKV